jgi:hypothetical protein
MARKAYHGELVDLEEALDGSNVCDSGCGWAYGDA